MMVSKSYTWIHTPKQHKKMILPGPGFHIYISLYVKQNVTYEDDTKV